MGYSLLDSYSRNWKMRGYSDVTLGTYLGCLRRFVRDVLGGDESALIEVDRQTLDAYVQRRMERVSANSASNDVRAFKSFYKFLEEDDEIDVNPAKRLRQPKVGQPNVKVATDDDLAKMLAVCGRDKLGRRDAAIISLIAYLGVRRADVCVIDLEHLELEAATLTIPTSKNRKPRTVPLHPEVVGRIDRYLRLRGERPGALFLPHRGERLKPNGVGQMIERRANAAGVDVRAHAFRRRFAVDFWRRSGGNIVSLQYLGDWTSPAMPARYTASERSRLAAEDLRRVWGQ